MARHFLQLYLMIVATLALASWGQERLTLMFETRGATSQAAAREPAAAVLTLVEQQLRALPGEQRQAYVAALARRTGIDLELFGPQDIAGSDIRARLERGELAAMASDERQWLLKRLSDGERILAYRHPAQPAPRARFEWLLSLGFYAAIALVLMIWLWPLTRDLRRLEYSTTRFGHGNWAFDADIRPGSQVWPLAEAFRRMAGRIDGLIRSQKDMSNAVSHEIKTPLARMRFEIEMARNELDAQRRARHMNNLETDIVELNSFVTAALDYAILERAEVALNLGEHDFTVILPAVTESVQRSAPQLELRCEVQSNATRVVCDAHLIETVLRNLLYNATRYARREIRVVFALHHEDCSLHVDDDGPGIPEADWQRVFGSFVRLGDSGAEQGVSKAGYGLGLAIVNRIIEWHGGGVLVRKSDLGGARFSVHWPLRPMR